MDLYEALYTTRSMRRLKPDPIPNDVQARILDAAIRAPHIGEGWRFLLVDDAAIKSQLAPLYRQGFERLLGAPLEALADMMTADSPMGRTVRSGVHLVHHFHEVPLLLIDRDAAVVLCRRGDGHPRRAEGRGLAHARGHYDGLPTRHVEGRCSETGPRGRGTE